ncbi:MAG: hypothetical protein HKN09_05870 [Saprospiraceae bacterium]|nr:hypothetical protein [Saprospiraceae bacterium]
MRIVLSILLLVFLDTVWVQAYHNYPTALPQSFHLECYESRQDNDQFSRSLEHATLQSASAKIKDHTLWWTVLSPIYLSNRNCAWQCSSDYNINLKPILLFIRICPHLFEVNLRITG